MRRFDTIYSNPVVSRISIDIPNINSNSTVVVDSNVPGLALGTHIITWAPVTTATTMDDLLMTFMIVAVDTIRTVFYNPTGGAINPDSIDFEFVTATVNPLIDP